MIRVAELVKVFGGVRAVDGVGFTAADGAITGLLGHNGAGKSTTLRILYGLLKADSGTAHIDGVDVALEPLQAQRLTGVMTDAHGLYPRLTAREHITYFGELRGLTRQAIAKRTGWLLDALNMEAIADRRAEGFSQGERMKVCLARALVHDPKNLILDEPTNGLDVMTTRSVRNLLQQLRAEGKCILLSSHVMQEISTLCDDVVIIAAGKVRFHGTPDALRRQTGIDDLEEAFVSVSGVEPC